MCTTDWQDPARDASREVGGTLYVRLGRLEIRISSDRIRLLRVGAVGGVRRRRYTMWRYAQETPRPDCSPHPRRQRSADHRCVMPSLTRAVTEPSFRRRRLQPKLSCRQEAVNQPSTRNPRRGERADRHCQDPVATGQATLLPTMSDHERADHLHHVEASRYARTKRARGSQCCWYWYQGVLVLRQTARSHRRSTATGLPGPRAGRGAQLPGRPPIAT